MQIMYRSQILDPNLMGTTGGIWTKMGDGPGNATNFLTAFVANTSYTMNLQVTRANTNYTQVTCTYTNAAGTNWTVSARDTNGVFYRFDSAAMRLNSSQTAAQSWTIPYYWVRVIPVPWQVESMHLGQAVHSGNNVNLTWNTIPGTDKASFAYSVQYKTNLLDTNWITLTTNITTTAYTHTNPPNATGFYRVRYPGT